MALSITAALGPRSALDPPVIMVPSCSSIAEQATPVCSGAFSGSGYGAAEFGVDIGLFEKQCYLVHLRVAAVTLCQTVEGGEVASDYLVFGSLAAYLVVIDAEAYHVYSHVGG